MNGSVFGQIDVVIVDYNAEGGRKELQLPRPQEAQRNFILFIILIGILVAEGDQNLLEGFPVGGHVQPKIVQPGLVDPQNVLRTGGMDRRKRTDLAVGQGDGFHPVGIFRQKRPQMGSVFFQQGLQVDQLAGIGVADQFFAGQAGLEQHIRQFAGRKHLLLGLLPVGAAFVLLKGEGNAGAFLHPYKKLVGFPIVIAVFAVVARHGKSGFRVCHSQW